MREHARGMVLGMVIVMALVGSIASYGILQIGLNQSFHARFHKERTRARYAAEVGVVWAQQRLFQNELWGDPAGDIDLTIDGIDIDVIVATCGAPPCPGRTIQAKVVY